MTLLKTLQHRLTSIDLPWLPPQHILIDQCHIPDGFKINQNIVSILADIPRNRSFVELLFSL